MIVNELFDHAKQHPHKTAIIFENQLITYEELANNIILTAHALLNHGVKIGDRILLHAHSAPKFIYTYFATHHLGAIAVPIDPKATSAYIDFIVNQTNPAYIFEKYPENSAISKKKLSVNDFSKQKNFENIADIIFTTGTTGDPKGVALTHQSITSSAMHINAFIKNTTEDYEIIPLPLYRSFGLGRVRSVMLKGGSIILLDGFHSMAAFFRALKEHCATGLSAVPAGIAILFQLTKDKIGEFSNQLRYIEIGSAPMPVDHKKKLLNLLPKTRLCLHYGLTEASRSTFTELSHDNLESIGKPAPSVEIKIVTETGNVASPHVRGEICIKGHHVMDHYWNNPELTRRTLVDGWMHTEDVGYQDERGYLYLDGRKQDIINIGGEKVSPIEIEMQLKQHPAIQDCACIGIPCPRGISGEAIKAVMTLSSSTTTKPSDQELITFLRITLESHKIPAKYEWVDEIPRTNSGKIQRSILREREKC